MGVRFAHWRQCTRFLPHALACLPLLDQAAPEFADATALLYKAGTYLLQRGRYRDAEPLLTMALRRAEGCFVLTGRVTLGRFIPLERIRNLSDQVAGEHPILPQALGGRLVLGNLPDAGDTLRPWEARVLRPT